MLRRLRITFLLPGPGHIPVGGGKVVYEYANRLSRLGHSITVVHAASLYKDDSLYRRLRLKAGFVHRALDRSYRPDAWFHVDPAVSLTWVPSLKERNIPDADVVIATAWQTAEWATGYSARKGRGFYLIQGLELWSGHEDRVYETWRSPLRKIVIARWLEDIAKSLDRDAAYIPNGLDFEVFDVDRPICERPPLRVAMLYHSADYKGAQDGIEALRLVREQFPELQAVLFGVPPRPAGLPEWFTYYRCASPALLRTIYNDASVFVAPSWTEGWGLTASEAMMCGAAVAATDIGGHREFAIDEQTALLSPPKNPERLANNVLRLLQDKELRQVIAKRGRTHVSQFTWERAVRSVEALLFEEVK